MCSWTVATEDLSPLPAPTGEQKRARDKQKKTTEDRNRKKIEKEEKVSIKRRTSGRSTKQQLNARKNRFKEQLAGDLETSS
jgi:hypothetical protein